MGAPAGFVPPRDIYGRGARSALRHHRIEIRFHAIEQQRGQFFRQAIERGHRRHKGRLRAIGQLCCLLGRCVLYLRRCISGGTTGREAGLRYSAGRAQRGRVVPLYL
jgi:hypothetical protein